MSVVVPFVGSRLDAAEIISAIEALRLRARDEAILVDNTPEGVAPEVEGVRTVRATAERSSYYARNVGAEHAVTEWVLFMDSDCRPPGDLIDRLFAERVPERCGIVAGGVRAAAGQTALVARYARSRGHLDLAYFTAGERPAGITANLLVRRAAWAQVGGFFEGVRSGEDAEFCWRVQDAGWELVARPEAAVEHLHPERLGPMLRKAARWAAGRAWVDRRHRGAAPPPRVVRSMTRSAAAVGLFLLTARPERAAFKAIDALMAVAEGGGRWLENRPPGWDRAGAEAQRPPTVAIVTDAFPALSETFISNEAQALAEAGRKVLVEASVRPPRPEREAARATPARYLEDDGRARKVLSFAWLVARHPLRCLADRRDRARWAREEEVWPLNSLGPPARRLARERRLHLHAHFAATAGLNALRLSRLLGCPYSITAHAYDIYREPRNLREKLERATFSTSGCEYTVSYLRDVVGPEHRDRVHEIVMGVRPERFRRRTGHPDGRRVAAVGRLVEKKGFRHLVEAAALLHDRGAPAEVTIVGDGPLRGELETLVADLGAADLVTLEGWRDPEGVRDLLEASDVLAMPCVVAADGDRDSMPVVVKEAMAMEIPVVVSHEVGLPELVTPDVGVTVSPGDSRALADGLASVLDLPRERRIAMGRAGRARVEQFANLATETAKLDRLIEERG